MGLVIFLFIYFFVIRCFEKLGKFYTSFLISPTIKSWQSFFLFFCCCCKMVNVAFSGEEPRYPGRVVSFGWPFRRPFRRACGAAVSRGGPEDSPDLWSSVTEGIWRSFLNFIVLFCGIIALACGCCFVFPRASKNTRVLCAFVCVCDHMDSNVPACTRPRLQMWACVFVVGKGHFSMRDCVLCSRASNTHGREGLLLQLTVASRDEML